jgi:hypothetical protein
MGRRYCKWQSNAQTGTSADALSQGSDHQLVPVGQRTRLLGVFCDISTATLEFSNGSVGDTTLFDIKIQKGNNNDPLFYTIPNDGILFDNGVNLKMASSNSSNAMPQVGIFYEA